MFFNNSLISKEGHLILNLPDEKQYTFGDANDFKNIMYIKNTDFFRKIVFSGNIGMGESFMMNDWDTPDLTSLLTLFNM